VVDKGGEVAGTVGRAVNGGDVHGVQVDSNNLERVIKTVNFHSRGGYIITR